MYLFLLYVMPTVQAPVVSKVQVNNVRGEVDL